MWVCSAGGRSLARLHLKRSRAAVSVDRAVQAIVLTYYVDEGTDHNEEILIAVPASCLLRRVSDIIFNSLLISTDDLPFVWISCGSVQANISPCSVCLVYPGNELLVPTGQLLLGRLGEGFRGAFVASCISFVRCCGLDRLAIFKHVITYILRGQFVFTDTGGSHIK